MSTFPSGGMTVSNEDTGSVALVGTIFSQGETFDPGAAATTYPQGTILGRITATGKLRAAVVGAGDGSAIPVAVLPDDLTSDAVPSDVPIQIISGGPVREARLIFAPAAVGVLTPAQKDLLRDYGIIPQSTQELGILDNQ